MNSAVTYLANITGFSVNQIFFLAKNASKFYSDTIQPKIKFGLPQRDDNDLIKWRELNRSFYLLKKIQQLIHKNIFHNLQLPDYAYGSVNKRNNILNALQHCKSRYFLSIDLKDYFSLINERQVLNAFLNTGLQLDLAKLLTRLTTYKGFLPQGAPTSPTISNLVFVKTGLKLLDLCKKRGITFTTYLDDLTFSSKEDFKELVCEILRIIKEGGFYSHPKKIRYRKNSTEITGLIVRNGRLFLTKEMTERKDSDHLAGYKKGIKRVEQKFLRT